MARAFNRIAFRFCVAVNLELKLIFYLSEAFEVISFSAVLHSALIYCLFFFLLGC